MRRPLLAAVIVLLHASFSSSQTTPTTRLIPYSGTASDAAGLPLRGAVTVTFELYEEENGGAPLWNETQEVQADERGRYVVYLGRLTPIPQVAFSEERARWLAVSLHGREVPRVMLVAVPYALRAADAETLGGRPASSFVRQRADGRLESSAGLVVAEPLVDGSGTPGQIAKFTSATAIGSSTISESATNRVGFGLTDPTGGGVVDSVFTIRNFDNNTGFGILNQTQQRRFAINTLFSGGWAMYDGGGGIWNQGLTQLSGRVGLGTTAPTARLEVATAAQTGMQSAIRATLTNPNAAFPPAMGIRSRVMGMGEDGDGAVQVIGMESIVSNTVSPDSWGFTAAVLGYTDRWGGRGVFGASTHNDGGAGVYGFAEGSGTAVRGVGLGEGGFAGVFSGRVVVGGNLDVNGTLSKGGGSFKIDHPLDPTHKYLQHSFVESPDMMNVYNGNVSLDESGEAWVTLPDWFEALNRDFRYQLTPIGAPGPNLHIASEVTSNRFKIAGGPPNARVSWQVTGVRQDAWANAHRIAVEEVKPPHERGSYLHPTEHGQPGRPDSATADFARPSSSTSSGKK